MNTYSRSFMVLTRENIEGIIRFAHKYKLFIFADEVYQDNIYAEGSKFFAFKKNALNRQRQSQFSALDYAVHRLNSRPSTTRFTGEYLCTDSTASLSFITKGWHNESGETFNIAKSINQRERSEQCFVQTVREKSSLTSRWCARSNLFNGKKDTKSVTGDAASLI
ncbi:hypothetical protein K1T71_005853 [Dendrolimus kikuchii]|uniref:Uncharacterized protein n=1 Tax=Dendrolimus kikuchii TaxID=765133 RepID=A0ACC1D2I5_9NEOP|nr:hypothetical protein K1T71_005853 [Dendrolimus kikuchii]